MEILYYILVISQIVFSIISYVPQIIQLIKTKKSEDCSISTWALLTLSFLDYGIILLMDKVKLSLIVLNVFEMSLCLITTILVIYYKKNTFFNKKINK